MPVSCVPDLARASGGPESAAARIERSERLFRALLALDDDERQALLARHSQDLPVAAIAKDLGRSETATRRLLGRAAGRLGALLGGKEEVR